MGTKRTLGRLAEESWNRLGDFDALHFEGAWHRGHDLAERTRRVTGGLKALGVEPGDRVVVMMVNCPEVQVAYQALWAAGAVVTPVLFLVSAEELRHIVADSEPRAVIASAELLPAVLAATDGLDVAVVTVGEVPEGAHGGTRRVSGFAELEQAPEAGAEGRDEERPGGADVHRRHNGPRQRRDAQPRGPVARLPGRPRSHPPARGRPGHRPRAARTRTG